MQNQTYSVASVPGRLYSIKPVSIQRLSLYKPDLEMP
jgi:hypothetical protein